MCIFLWAVRVSVCMHVHIRVSCACSCCGSTYGGRETGNGKSAFFWDNSSNDFLLNGLTPFTTTTCDTNGKAAALLSPWAPTDWNFSLKQRAQNKYPCKLLSISLQYDYKKKPSRPTWRLAVAHSVWCLQLDLSNLAATSPVSMPLMHVLRVVSSPAKQGVSTPRRRKKCWQGSLKWWSCSHNTKTRLAQLTWLKEQEPILFCSTVGTNVSSGCGVSFSWNLRVLTSVILPAAGRGRGMSNCWKSQLRLLQMRW